MQRSALITVLIFAGFSQWVAAAELNVGVVNLSRLLAEAPQAVTAQQTLRDEFSPRRQLIKTQEEALLSTAEQLKIAAPTMDSESLQAAEVSLRQKRRELGRQQELFLEAFNARRNEALGALQQSLLSEVEHFASQQDYDLIIGEGILISDPSVDITSQVLLALRARFTNEK